MKQILGIPATLLLAGLLSTGSHATEILISGVVVATSCEVDSSSVSQTVDFKQVRRSILFKPGGATDWKPFKVKLINCPATVSSATAKFTGTPSIDDSSLFANAGTANNVAVQIASDADKTQTLGPDSTMTVNVDAENNAIYALVGRLYSSKGGVSSGTFSSVVEMDFSYQ